MKSGADAIAFEGRERLIFGRDFTAIEEDEAADLRACRDRSRASGNARTTGAGRSWRCCADRRSPNNNSSLGRDLLAVRHRWRCWACRGGRDGELGIPIPFTEGFGEIQAQIVARIGVLIFAGRGREPVPDIEAVAEGPGEGYVAEFNGGGLVRGLGLGQEREEDQ